MPPVSTPPRGTRWDPSTAVSRICSSTAPEYSIPKECPGALHVANFGATAVPVIGSMPILLSQGTITSLGHFIETYGMAESEEQHGRAACPCCSSDSAIP